MYGIYVILLSNKKPMEIISISITLSYIGAAFINLLTVPFILFFIWYMFINVTKLV